MKYRQFRILQAVSFMTNIPTYSHKGHAASIGKYSFYNTRMCVAVLVCRRFDMES